MVNFGVLNVKDIIDILDGDVNFGEEVIDDYRKISISLPYLTFANICSIAVMFGYEHLNYNKMAGTSRWCVFSYLLECCLEENRIEELLVYLVSLEKFRNKLLNVDQDKIEEMREKCIQSSLEGINKILFFSKCKLVFENEKFYLCDVKGNITPACPKIDVLSKEYISDIRNRALKDVENKEYDSAVTKSRTMLEEVFIKMIEGKNILVPTNGNINDLYKIVKENYNLKQGPQLDSRINDLLTGLNKIITSISEMRNINSDSHGAGSKRISISEHHTRLLVNSAITSAEFFVSIYLNSK